MKIAFISDIHGNAVALEAVLRDLKKKEINKVYVLGDICYRGPEPEKSLSLVRNLHTKVIKGNADEWVVRGVNEGEVATQALEIMNRERDWTFERLESGDIDYLNTLPHSLAFEENGVKIHAFHATPNSLFDIVSPETKDEDIKEKLMSKVDSHIYVYGHIHKPYIRYINGKVVMNVGSIGLPFDGLAKASYGLLKINESGISTSIERVDYDVEKVIKQYQDSGYPNAKMMINILKNASL
ncbi:metallophosphoesterase family protein [Metabacillus litoralis]|uniref:metallophosphoesterase family protein n=1 Tax=Metabacillus TaxID=2675233 RepID=UPI000EF5A35F|nr:metallophosphoesterase family protein [Metabacillus litoralis]MCM3163903.1 metallophosphoesterase family protein [Metabacillus litoralis]MCM3410584.1 metallophosphoesterase family protein [Metabacillus litoralis]UHA58328.1 metallophosphoesterase family protein [Metabacillus litoralis]